MKKSFKIVFLFLIFILNAEAQSAIWTRYYDPSGTTDAGIDALQMQTGEYMILTNSKSGMYFVKIDYLGNVIWNKIVYPYGGSYRFIQTADKGFAICGMSNSNRMILIKTNMDGDTTWTESYTINGRQSRAASLKETHDHGFILCGSVYPPFETYIVKTDSLGNLEWQNTYSASTASDIVESMNGNFYSVSYSILRKIDSSGNQVWVKPTGSALRLVDSNDGYLYLAGGTGQFYFAKFDTSGNSIFQNYFFNNAGAKDICLDKDGNLLLAGSINVLDSLGFNQNAMYAKFSPRGDLIFSKAVNTSGLFEDLFSSCNITSDTGYILCGQTNYPTPGIFELNILAVKTDSAGNTSPIVGINSNGSEIINDFELEQNYPNPFNSTTIIKYNLNVNSNIRLFISDVNGKVVLDIFNEKQIMGNHNYFLDGINFPSGVYFINLKTENYRKVKKMLIIK